MDEHTHPATTLPPLPPAVLTVSLLTHLILLTSRKLLFSLTLSFLRSLFLLEFCFVLTLKNMIPEFL